MLKLSLSSPCWFSFWLIFLFTDESGVLLTSVFGPVSSFFLYLVILWCTYLNDYYVLLVFWALNYFLKSMFFFFLFSLKSSLSNSSMSLKVKKNYYLSLYCEPALSIKLMWGTWDSSTQRILGLFPDLCDSGCILF